MGRDRSGRGDLDDRRRRIAAQGAEATVYRWTSDGSGPPFYKIGGHNRWKRSEVLA